MLLLFEYIHHRQRNDDRDAEFEKLHYEIKVTLEIGGVDNRDDGVRFRNTVLLARDDVPGNMLVERRRVEAVKARQIDQVCMAAFELPRTMLALDSYAGIVCDLLFKARE